MLSICRSWGAGPGCVRHGRRPRISGRAEPAGARPRVAGPAWSPRSRSPVRAARAGFGARTADARPPRAPGPSRPARGRPPARVAVTSRCRPAATPSTLARGRCRVRASSRASRRCRCRVRTRRRCFSKRAGGDQFGQCELTQCRAGDVRPALALDDLLAQRGRSHQPAQPQRRGQRLGHATQVGDTVRGHRLQRGHRWSVVAVLGVVVVLDDQATGPGPADQLPPPLGGQHHPGGELVGRGDHHDGQPGVCSARPRPGRGRPPGPGGRPCPIGRAGRGYPPSPGPRTRRFRSPRAAQRLHQHGQALRDPVDHDHLGRRGCARRGCGSASRPAPCAAPGCRAGRRSPSSAGGCRGQCVPLGAKPGLAGKRRQVGHAGGEVDLDRRRLVGDSAVRGAGRAVVSTVVPPPRRPPTRPSSASRW